MLLWSVKSDRFMGILTFPLVNGCCGLLVRSFDEKEKDPTPLLNEIVDLGVVRSFIHSTINTRSFN